LTTLTLDVMLVLFSKISVRRRQMSEAEKKSFESEFATKVITKAWSDPAYKAKLVADPRAALAEAGLNAPANLNIKVVENTNSLVHLVLPPPPSAELSEESLAMVSGGWIPAARTHFDLGDIQRFNLSAFTLWR
jgi:hypothetical protein